ncbi:PDZ domain-containing protein [Pontibacillus yanchengensis]|uniref:PDZ domain-containing protein n=2 Tax=Pontibacillus yanchengensis TaxID=462910 RepID=A0ACC7VI18_9BACI|nr:trypsin-like peptidase domain-containing protein [Pontibacillus yanchengensis]MYL34462.1 PDZ domain-containing protein [Pontibacillus yanchengensis]MYL54270.1 PDZ domain-containing protein [Pontibacillus yanchengensis]
MGYYDDHASSRNRHKRPGWIAPTVVGLILGSVLIILALPALIQSNILPYDVSIQNNEEPQGDEGQNVQADEGTSTPQNVNVDVTTQVTEVVQDVQETVVGVVNIQSSSSDFFSQQEGSQTGTGSGVIYKKEKGSAYVVTNHHVVQGASAIEIALIDGSRIEATKLGSDPYTDLAVLKVDGSKVNKAISLGDSSNVKVGESALAIGNPLGLMFAGSVTKGIISGKQRAIPQDLNGDGRMDWQAEVIQTDAAINPGNSGGALINIKGQLIGINSMKIAKSAVEGIGFAIPIDLAKPIIDNLENDGEVTRPYMGIEAYSLSELTSNQWRSTLELPEEVEAGVFIKGIEPTSPADQAGLEQYDVITKLDDTKVTNIVDLRKHLYEKKKVGEKMSITFYRKGEKKETTMELASQSY